MIIRTKHNGYVNGNNRLYPGGGGGPNTTYSQTSNIPEYMEPYATKMLEAAGKQVYNGDSFRPFKSYSSYDTARGGTGETVAGFTPTQVQAMRGIENYQLPEQTGVASQMAGYAGLGSMGAGQQYARQATNPYAMQAYMSPYMEGAVAPELREAARQSAMLGQQNQAQAVQQGAFGGSRSGIVEAERQRNLGMQQADIYGKGQQQAFQQAQQAQQFGANLGLQGYGQAGQMAGTLGGLGQQQFGQEMGVLGQQQAIGAQQQQYEQQRLNQIIQDYATSQQYPFMQLGVLNSMLRGMPMQSSSTSMYQAQPSGLSQVAGGLGTGLGLMEQYNKAFPSKKEGGVVKMASGGITSGVPAGKLPSMLEKLSDDQLGKKDSAQDMDPLTRDMVDTEQARRSRLRGMAGGGAVAFADGKMVKEGLTTAPVGEAYAAEERERRSNVDSEAKPEPQPEPQPQPVDMVKEAAYIRDVIAKEKEKTKAKFPTGITADARPVAKDVAQTEPVKQKRITQGIAQALPTSVQDTKFDKMLAQYQKDRPVKPAVGQKAAVPAAEPKASQDTGIREGAAKLSSAVAPSAEKIGIATETDVAAKAPAEDETVNLLRAQAAGYKKQSEVPVSEMLKAQEEEYKKLGIVNPAMAEQAGLAGRKATIESDAQETAKSRLIQFLVDWGKTPGSAIKGAITAGSNLIESSIEDRKLRRKLLSELDAVERDIKKSEYLRQVGDVDKAKAVQRDAGVKYYGINEKLLEYKAKIEVQQLKNEIAQLKGEAKNGVVQQAEILYKGMVAAGKPEGDITRAIALKEALSMQPGPTSAAVSAASQQAIAAPKAAMDVKELTVKEQTADTAQQRERREQQEAYDKAVRQAKRDKGEAIRKAKREDPTGKKAAELETEIETGLKKNYPLLQGGAPAAPAKKIVEPVKPAGSAAAAPVAPVAKWDPVTKSWK